MISTQLSQLKHLDDRSLAIYHAELMRQHKSVGVAYLLLILLGGFGAHAFYLGRSTKGVRFALFCCGGWLLALFSIFGAAATGSAVAGIFLFLAIGMLACAGIEGLIDLFTLPSQIRKAEQRLKMEILLQLGASRE